MLCCSHLSHCRCFAAVDEARDDALDDDDDLFPAPAVAPNAPTPPPALVLAPNAPLPLVPMRPVPIGPVLMSVFVSILDEYPRCISSESLAARLSWVRHFFEASFNSACVRAINDAMSDVFSPICAFTAASLAFFASMSFFSASSLAVFAAMSLFTMASSAESLSMAFLASSFFCHKPAIILSNHSIPLFTEAVSIGGAPPPPPVALDTEAEEASSCCWIMMSACGIVVVVVR